MGDHSHNEGGGAVHGLAVHAVVFVAVNLMLIVVWALVVPTASFAKVPDLLANPSQAKAADFFPIYVLMGWGVGLLIHAGVVLVGTPGRRRRRRARRRQRRAIQAGVIGALGEGVLADAAVAGISYVDGDRAAKQARRDADRQRSKARSSSRATPGSSNGRSRNGSSGTGTRGTAPNGDRDSTGDRRRTDPDAPPPTWSPPDVTPARRWVAVMFTDIVDSTPLNQHYGDERWADLLSHHRQVVRELVRANHGVEVGTQGDGFLVRFDTPDDAAACAVALQCRLAAERTTIDRPLHVRIGIHAGEVVHNDDDLVGRVINLASRVTTEAAPDEILVTEPFADHLADPVPLVDRGLRTLKGFEQPRHLLALPWEQVDQILLDD